MKKSDRRTNFFSTRKSEHSIPDFSNAVKQVFQITPNLRTHFEMQLAMEYLIHLNCMRKIVKHPYETDVFLQLAAQKFELENFVKGSLVVGYKSNTRKVYIITKGSVQKFIHKSKEELNTEPPQQTENKRPTKFTSQFAQVSHLQSPSEKSPKNLASTQFFLTPSNRSSMPVKRTTTQKKSFIHIEGSNFPTKDLKNSRRDSRVLSRAGSRGSKNGSRNGSRRASRIFHADDFSSNGSDNSYMLARNHFPDMDPYDAEKYLKDDILFESVKLDPSKVSHFLLGNECRVKRSDVIKEGDIFGEDYIQYDNFSNKHYYLAAEDISVLSLTKADFDEIMAKLIESQREKVDFFVEMYPDLRERTLNKLTEAFKEEKYKRNNTIFHEGEETNKFYFLCKGDLQLLVSNKAKFSKSTRHQDKSICLATVFKNQFFGEELLLDIPLRMSSAVCLNEVTCYSISVKAYNEIKVEFVKIFQKIRDQSLDKIKWRVQRLTEIVENQPVFEEMLSPSQHSHLPSIQISPQHKEIRHHRSPTSSVERIETEASISNQLSSMKSLPVLKTLPDARNSTLYKTRFLRQNKNEVVNHNEECYNKFLKAKMPVFPSKRDELRILTEIPTQSPTFLRPSQMSVNYGTNPRQTAILTTNPESIRSSSIGQTLVGTKDLVIDYIAPDPEYTNEKEVIFSNKDGTRSILGGRSKIREVLNSMETAQFNQVVEQAKKSIKPERESILEPFHKPAFKLKKMNRKPIAIRTKDERSLMPFPSDSGVLARKISPQVGKGRKYNMSMEYLNRN